MSTYFSFFRMRFLTLIQYRAAAAAGIATQWVFGMMRVLVLWAFYASSDAGQPMSFAQTASYVWIGQAMLGTLPWNEDAEIMSSVLTGQVAYELTRPLDVYSMWFARTLALRTAPTILRAVRRRSWRSLRGFPRCCAAWCWLRRSPISCTWRFSG